MSRIVRGRVWKLGDDIDTDQMAPFGTLASEWEEVRASMFPARRELIAKMSPGDVLVGGRNFGCGSSREHAPENLKKLGLSGVIAESFGRIYFRNCIAIAFPNVACPGVGSLVEEGDVIEADLTTGVVRNVGDGRELAGSAYTPDMLAIIEKGGLMKLLEERVARGELG